MHPMARATWSLGSALGILIVLGACAQPSVPAVATQVAATVEPATTAVASLEARFDPTAAVGGGSNTSGAISAAELSRIFGSVAQAAQMRFSASASPTGATGAAVTSVSITAEDTASVLKSLDASAKRAAGEALLNAAAQSWPQARITLLVTSAGGGQIIGTRPQGGPNTVIVM
jgi:hypothetical protein